VTKLTSRLTSKGQATIPKPVRDHLGLRAGDAVQFVVEQGRVVLRRPDPLDDDYLRLATTAFDDWNAPEADDAFRDL
jgi:AbrB family looped-hinge helix DNA binding protein